MIQNIAAYRFIVLTQSELKALRSQLIQWATSLKIKGTVLLSDEGININLAGTPTHIEQLIEKMQTFPALRGLLFKNSFSNTIPFQRLFVKIKEEIIAFKQPDIKPEQQTAPYVSPAELKAWYESGKDMIVLDTRNDYEVAAGHFENAIHLDIDTFRAFPEAVAKLLAAYRKKTIVTYCTGGIRCEKAALYLQLQGFEEVYQLSGGILQYFMDCGGEHYQGDCFVFDDRLYLDPNLKVSTGASHSCDSSVRSLE